MRQNVLKLPTQMLSEFEKVSSQERSFETALTEQEKSALDLSKKTIRYKELQRDLETDRALFESVLKRMKETDLTKGIQADPVQIVEAASFNPAPNNQVAKGQIISIFGSNFLPSGRADAAGFPLPTQLGSSNTSVAACGQNIPLINVFPGQINAQAPDDTTTGVVPIAVTTALGTTTSTIRLAQAGPSFLLLADARHATGIIVTPSGGGTQGGGTYDLLGPSTTGPGFRAAKKGEPVAIYAVGLGPTART